MHKYSSNNVQEANPKKVTIYNVVYIYLGVTGYANAGLRG